MNLPHCTTTLARFALAVVVFGRFDHRYLIKLMIGVGGHHPDLSSYQRAVQCSTNEIIATTEDRLWVLSPMSVRKAHLLFLLRADARDQIATNRFESQSLSSLVIFVIRGMIL